MTESAYQPSGRRLVSEVHYIRMAAVEEAIALGHHEVDVDHLLVGLLVAGGPSAHALVAVGVDLQAVRKAVGEVQEQDLATLGVTARSQREVTHAAERLADPTLPVNVRAQALLDDAPYRTDDRGLLLALLDDDGRRAQRALECAGVNVGDLRERLGRGRLHADSTPERAAYSGEALRGPAPEGATWMEASYSQVLPVPIDQAWALVSDPSRRAQWDATCTAVTVTPDGLERLTLSSGHTRIQAVIQVEHGRTIAWREHRDGNADHPAHQILQLMLHPDGNTTRLELYRSWPARGWGVRLSRPLLVRMVRAQMRIQAQGIAHAA